MEQSQPKHQLTTFDSGLRLVTIPMEGTKTATVLVLVGTGSKYESKEINGISHFLEHMMFKGTTKRPGKLDIARELDSIGASYNAFTAKEWTGYYAKASAAKLDVIMDVVFDIFLNSKLSEEAINTERGVIIQEINMYRDTPSEYVGELFDELLYGDQPAGWSIAGQKETILKLKQNDFVEYFNTHYVSGNTIVAVAGNIDPEEVKEKTRTYFSDIRRGTPFPLPSVKEQQVQPNLLIHQKKTDQSHMVLGCRAYNLHDDRHYALSVLATILGGGMSSRLFSEVRDKRGLAYHIEAGVQPYTNNGYFEVVAGISNDHVHEALKVIMEELSKVKSEGVTPLELRQAIDQTVGRLALAMEHSNFVAKAYADSVLYHGKVLTPEEELDKIKKVTLADIMQVAGEIFDSSKLNLALIGPFEDKKPFEEILKFL